MKQRAITGTIMMLVVIPLILLDVLLIPFQVVFGLLSIAAVYELIRMYERQHQLHWLIKTAIYLLTAGFYVLVGNVWQGPNALIANLTLNVSYVLWPTVLILFILCIFNSGAKDHELGFSFLTILYAGLGFGAITFLRVLGAQYVLYLFITTISTDMFAYFFGIKFGKHKMAPTISPKKSWEGAIAGTVFGTVFGTLFGIVFLPTQLGTLFAESSAIVPVGVVTLFEPLVIRGTVVWRLIPVILPITLAVSIVAQLGDLFASKLKRTYEIKDFGTIFPGHGGILDRFDSAIFGSIFLIFIFKVLTTLWPGI
ncbi:MAG: phosphatidate cytidylyltransferase [Acholeplasmataceae bacterium]|jgi:phosphatidate cytidylyltransferase